jgi:hypothetical protein
VCVSAVTVYTRYGENLIVVGISNKREEANRQFFGCVCALMKRVIAKVQVAQLRLDSNVS